MLVTGASGYIALHCVQQLLVAGFSVRGTVRSLQNAQKVRRTALGFFHLFVCLMLNELSAHLLLCLLHQVNPLYQLRNQFAQFPGQLELVEADLECADHWAPVIRGCTSILHVASPWPIVADASTIRTAVDGTMNVLRAAAECGGSVRKVVMTSSCAAINGWLVEEECVEEI